MKDFRYSTWNDETPFCFDAWATELDDSGFAANVSGSGNAERLAVTWIVWYRGKGKVASGTFGTEDVVGRKGEAAKNCGRVVFPQGLFDKTPTVLVGLSQFDLAGGRDLRIGAYVDKVDTSGFQWQLRECHDQFRQHFN